MSGDGITGATRCRRRLRRLPAPRPGEMLVGRCESAARVKRSAGAELQARSAITRNYAAAVVAGADRDNVTSHGVGAIRREALGTVTQHWLDNVSCKFFIMIYQGVYEKKSRLYKTARHALTVRKENEPTLRASDSIDHPKTWSSMYVFRRRGESASACIDLNGRASTTSALVES
ncbi:hypothetical protein EVAR_62453_1 [Eumeta japonica]|uniref:Uncharacterized protein n=1 Tax=Eumeta variegata TaxID=151549 RepID=A0A4C1YX02_EUMVA|nr:hypothetical protein EVAR_62453_1 [Eumeta japonica]